MENPKQEFVYSACKKNHVAKLGGHATNSYGEFFSLNDGSQCGACGCHRNFHQKIAVMGHGGGSDRKGASSSDTLKVEKEEEKNLQELMVVEQVREQQHKVVRQMSRGRRPRTKFTEKQRQKMFEFATSLGWRMQTERSDEINQFFQ